LLTLHIGVDGQHDCCFAVNRVLSASSMLHDATASGVAGKVNTVCSEPLIV
jgi:hypothetical protein